MLGLGMRLAGAVWKPALKIAAPAATLAGGGMLLNDLNNLRQSITSEMEKDLYKKKGKWNEDKKEYTIEDKGLFQSLGQRFNLIDSDEEIGNSKLEELYRKTVDDRNIIRSAGVKLPEFNPAMELEEARNTIAQPKREAEKIIEFRDAKTRQKLLESNPEFLLRQAESNATINSLDKKLKLAESQHKDQTELLRDRLEQQERLEQARLRQERERLNQQNNRDMFMIQERMFDRSHQRRRDTQNAMLGLGGALAAILSA